MLCKAKSEKTGKVLTGNSLEELEKAIKETNTDPFDIWDIREENGIQYYYINAGFVDVIEMEVAEQAQEMIEVEIEA